MSWRWHIYALFIIVLTCKFAMAISSNVPPNIESLTPNLQSPQDSSSTITWTAKASDIEGDQISYKFLLKGPRTSGKWDVVQDWSTRNSWKWEVEDKDSGSSDVSAWIKDKMHNSEMDDFKNYSEYKIAKGSEGNIVERPVKTGSLFSDSNLEAAIRAAIIKPEGDISPEDLSGLNRLEAIDKNIKNIIGLENCNNLTQLVLAGNKITDISPLSGLTNLTYLALQNNKIANISPLSRLDNLESLQIGANQIEDVSSLSRLKRLFMLALDNNQIENVSPLSGLTNLRQLSLGYNKIVDISPLSGLTNLRYLFLDSNKITDISPLSGLSKLLRLDISGNKITDVSPLSGLANRKITQ